MQLHVLPIHIEVSKCFCLVMLFKCLVHLLKIIPFNQTLNAVCHNLAQQGLQAQKVSSVKTLIFYLLSNVRFFLEVGFFFKIKVCTA